MGRPTSKWSDAYVAQAYRLAMLGLTDKEMAHAFDVSERQFNTWKKKYPQLLQSINNGKLPADGNVALSLYQRAIGYTHEEEIVRVLRNGTTVRVTVKKRHPPDVLACIYWLNNRQRGLWYNTSARKPKDEGDPQDTASAVADALRAMGDIEGVNVPLPADDDELQRALDEARVPTESGDAEA